MERKNPGKYLDKTFPLRMPADLHSILGHVAKFLGTSINQVILEVVAQELVPWLENNSTNLQYLRFRDYTDNKEDPETGFFSKLHNAKFIIKHKISLRDWSDQLIDAGIIHQAEDGNWYIDKNVPTPDELGEENSKKTEQAIEKPDKTENQK